MQIFAIIFCRNQLKRTKPLNIVAELPHCIVYHTLADNTMCITPKYIRNSLTAVGFRASRG